jgi:hypothetical protein
MQQPDEIRLIQCRACSSGFHVGGEQPDRSILTPLLRCSVSTAGTTLLGKSRTELTSAVLAAFAASTRDVLTGRYHHSIGCSSRTHTEPAGTDQRRAHRRRTATHERLRRSSSRERAAAQTKRTANEPASGRQRMSETQHTRRIHLSTMHHSQVQNPHCNNSCLQQAQFACVTCSPYEIRLRPSEQQLARRLSPPPASAESIG